MTLTDLQVRSAGQCCRTLNRQLCITLFYRLHSDTQRAIILCPVLLHGKLKTQIFTSSILAENPTLGFVALKMYFPFPMKTLIPEEHFELLTLPFNG